MKKTIPSLLTALILAGTLIFSACGGINDDDGAAETAVDETVVGSETADTVSETEPGEINRENAKLGLPELDFGGEVLNLLYVGEEVYRQDIYAEQNGEVVDDAVYARNMAIEELLNVKLNLICFSNSTNDTAAHIGNVVLAGDNLYDLCSTHQSYTTKLVTEGYFHNFADDEFIGWDNAWWNRDYMLEMGVGESRIYFLLGDISLMRMKSLACIYYNREMYESLHGRADEPYDLVFNGEWTFDRFSSLVLDAYSDLNGDSTVNVGDRFGAFGSKSKSVEHFQYACRVTTTTKDSEGIPRLTLNNERTAEFAEKFHNMYYNNIGFTIAASDKFETDITGFVSGYYLFCPVWFRHADQLRDMETDYGIINFPKYEESDEYSTLVHNGSTVFVTPITSQQTDKIGAVCEAMAYYNYVSVTPAYYEVALKVKYSRDDRTSQLLDLISASAYTNFGYVYSSTIAGMGTMRSFISANSNNFASWYAAKADAAQAGLDKLVELYLVI
ncbi:MAG: hypothetical protein GX628_01155 [Clostridiales bacterium]|nr:hypothetical protein [Clostridiales bacterium]